MNIPEIYLTEPYNAYAPKKKQKHWHEVIEEQALMAKILAEANRNSTLAPDMPNQATPQIQAIPPAGGGGMPTPQFFNPSMDIDFTLSPTTASAPALVALTNTGDSQLYSLDTVTIDWDFGDGTTGIGPNPIHLFVATGSNLVVTMSAVAKVDGTSIVTYQPIRLTAPTVTSAFTLLSPATLTAGYYTASAGEVIPFLNGTSTNNPSNPITYLWNFGSGSAPTEYGTSTEVNPSYSFADPGDYLVLLSATGSFGIANGGARWIQIV